MLWEPVALFPKPARSQSPARRSLEVKSLLLLTSEAISETLRDSLNKAAACLQV